MGENIPRSTILQLSSKNATSSNSNVDWTNTTPSITIKNGDQINVRMAVVDIGLSDNVSDIVLKDDLTITFTYGFYIIRGNEYNGFMGSGVQAIPPINSNYELYYVSESTDYTQANKIYPYDNTPFTNTGTYGTNFKMHERQREITIPKGTYSNGVFAEIVTNLLVTVLIDPTTNDMMQSENWMCPFNTQYFASKNAWSFNSTKPNTTSPWPGVGPGPFLVKQNDMRNQFKFVKDGLPPNILPETSFPDCAILQNNGAEPYIAQVGNVNPERWGPTDMVPQGPNCAFYPSTYTARNIMIGSTQVALVYDSENNVFKFNMFTPSIDANGNWQIKLVVTNYEDDAEFKYSLDRIGSVCGNFLMKMEDNYLGSVNSSDTNPDNLFFSKVLKFNVSDMCIPNVGNDITPKLIASTTSNLLVSQASIPYLIPTIYQGGANAFCGTPPNNEVVYLKTTDIETPPAMTSAPFSSLNVGTHYILSIIGIPQNQLLGEESKSVNCTVSAIITQAYTDSNLITVFNDTSPPYIHQGPDITLDLFNVHILDPDSKQSTTLITGDNHNIYLEITNFSMI